MSEVIPNSGFLPLELNFCHSNQRIQPTGQAFLERPGRPPHGKGRAGSLELVFESHSYPRHLSVLPPPGTLTHPSHTLVYALACLSLSLSPTFHVYLCLTHMHSLCLSFSLTHTNTYYLSLTHAHTCYPSVSLSFHTQTDTHPVYVLSLTQSFSYIYILYFALSVSVSCLSVCSSLKYTVCQSLFLSHTYMFLSHPL